ncbi:hypothetical protein J1N35_039981 [Gossypium stocksii]|uniref:non-specific serine/threonine protein kinase n=1 Tax=Gossypium stocksii TaxID=47602 RepID=A0A9D3UD88_9ROSI|nr:hypothetical protein J1N35_039981 [Gossypium stocksii]
MEKYDVLRYKRLLELENLGLTEELTLTLFSYKELKRATNGFKEELGKESFGAVYKGSLDRGRQLVAVKRLAKLVEEGEKEFQSEIRAIGRAHHKNLVLLLGYCVEDSKRLLVYEFMENKSTQGSESAKPTRLVEGDPFFCIASLGAYDLWLYSRIEGKVKWLQQRREKPKHRKLNHSSPLKMTPSSHFQSARFLLLLLPPSSVIQFLHGKK